MEILIYFNLIVTILFTLCYSYQFLYIPVSLFMKNKKKDITPTIKDFAILICARNEEIVIGDLLESINLQTYPREHVKVFVMADNCTDNTAAISHDHGAVVYERYNAVNIGKGYALEELLSNIKKDYPNGFDGYFVFDADNVLKSDYIEQMSRSFAEGNDIITSYRNSKNYGDNWISAGYALWFLRESRYLNEARYKLGLSCAVSGTGFFFSRKILDEIGSWHYHLLTEDIEFTADRISSGKKIAFCKDAVIYDEQPLVFSQSWHQRLRWIRGAIQVFGKYGKSLISNILNGNFSCYDFCMNIMPAYILSMLSLVINTSLITLGIVNGDNIGVALKSIFDLIINTYSTLFLIGAVTTFSEWKNIKTKAYKKILYAFTFPFFMFTYIPISFAAFFGDVTWKPIKHTKRAVQSLPSEVNLP